MKQLIEIVKMRDELKGELENCKNNKAIMLLNSGWAELDSEDKKEYSYLSMVIMKLMVQIDTLTYVINHDSQLPDVTEYPRLKQSRQ